MDQDKFSLLKSHVEAYTRKDGAVVAAHDDKRVAAAPKAPPLATHAAALAASSKPGELDHTDNQIAAGYMKANDHKSLAGHIKNLDTAARDHILDHVHPDHREGLGFKQLNMDRSKKQYAEKFSAKAANPKPDAGPAKGEVGHEEHKQYGAYFKKGDKVKDRYGKTHDVISHSGPEVKTSGGSFHPTKLFRQDSAKAEAKPDAPSEFGVHHSKLKEGDALYDKHGQKVDEVEGFSRGVNSPKVHTRAGYTHGTRSDGFLPGMSNKKPKAK